MRRESSMRMRFLLAAMALVAVLVFASCGDDDDGGGGDGGGGSGGGDAVTQKPSKKPEQLTVRIWAGALKDGIEEACGNPFTEKTGIPIKWDTSDEGAIHTKVNSAIRAGDRPPVDVSFQLQTRGYLNGVQDLSVPINPRVAPNLKKVTESVSKPPELPSEEGWEYANVYSFMIPVIIRTDRVKPSEIKSWEDLFDPKFKNSIEWDQQYASTAFPIAKLLGVEPSAEDPASMDPVWEKIAEAKPNIAILGDDAASVKALTSGEVDISIHGVFDKIEAEKAGAPVANVIPKEGALILGDSVYIHKGIPDATAYYAQVFINECLSAENQTKIAEILGVIPVNPEAKTPAYMEKEPRVFPVTEEQVAASAIIAPIPAMARNQDAWQAAFDEAVK
jgi:putative spermidine/putrescine transport system substrate-binding protein